MAAEVTDIYVKVQHAADRAAEGDSVSPTDEERALDGLKQLKKCKISTEILMATQLGKKLRKLSKHRSSKISSAAAQVVEAWKQLVAEETSAKSPANGKAPSKSAANGDSKSQKVLPSVKSEGSGLGLSSPTPSGKWESREGSSNGVATGRKESDGKAVVKKPPPAPAFDMRQLPKVGDSVRDKFRELVAAGLGLVYEELLEEHRDRAQPSDIVRATLAVEMEMWRTFGGGKKDKEYKAKYRSISFNLKDANNPDLRRRVLLGEVTPAQLLCMTADEMASDERKREKGMIEKKMLFETTRGVNMAASTDQFKCGKCGQRKTTYYQMQTRSADEPMTTYVTCMNCNNRWKFC